MSTIDWPARLRALVYTQFAPTNWAVPIANAIGARFDGMQGILDACARLWSIEPVVADSATADPAYGVGRGVQLDRIGRLVGQARGGATDAEYRPLLRARALANRADGTTDRAIGVFVAMFAGAGAPLYLPGWVMEYTLRLVGVLMDPILVPGAISLLAASTQAGVRAVLEYSTVAPSASLIADDLTPSAVPCSTGLADVAAPAAGGGMTGGAEST